VGAFSQQNGTPPHSSTGQFVAPNPHWPDRPSSQFAPRVRPREEQAGCRGQWQTYKPCKIGKDGSMRFIAASWRSGEENEVMGPRPRMQLQEPRLALQRFCTVG